MSGLDEQHLGRNLEDLHARVHRERIGTTVAAGLHTQAGWSATPIAVAALENVAVAAGGSAYVSSLVLYAPLRPGAHSRCDDRLVAATVISRPIVMSSPDPTTRRVMPSCRLQSGCAAWQYQKAAPADRSRNSRVPRFSWSPAGGWLQNRVLFPRSCVLSQHRRRSRSD